MAGRLFQRNVQMEDAAFEKKKGCFKIIIFFCKKYNLPPGRFFNAVNANNIQDYSQVERNWFFRVVAIIY